MPPITNAKKVCSTILSERKNVLPIPQRSPESPDPTVANIFHMIAASTRFRLRLYHSHPAARTPVNETTNPKKIHHRFCSIYEASTSATKAELTTLTAKTIRMC